MTAPEAAGHLTLRPFVAGGIHHLAGIELPARERPNQPQVLCRLAGLSRCFDIVVTAAALKRTRQSRLRKSQFCFVAQAALSARLLLSHDPAATTGLNDACADGKGGLRTQGGDRPACRHLRDRPSRRARRPVSGRSDVLLFRRRRSGCLLDFRLTPAAGFVRPCRWPDDRISRKRSPRGQRALRRRSSCAASRRTGSGAGRALGRRCYRRPRDGRRQRSDRPLR